MTFNLFSVFLFGIIISLCFRMMNPVPIVDASIDMILLVYNEHKSHVSEWDELVKDKVQTNLMVIKVT